MTPTNTANGTDGTPDASTQASKSVLITGCSTGIGRSAALAFNNAGWTTYATARRPETLTELEDAGIHTLALDVDDEKSMAAAVQAVVDAEGAVGVLVNNAGYSLTGAVESLDMDELRRQFETNVFGLVRMCQLVLPAMRAQQWGRIINVGSIGGRLTFPGMGAYHGTKYAVEAFSDALRYEVAPFGVKVSLIEPGIIKTAFNDTAHGTLDESDARDGGIYDKFHAGVAKALETSYTGPMGMLATGPETVAKVIMKAAGSSRPKSRYPITLGGRGALLMRTALPDAGWDLAMRTQFPPPTAPANRATNLDG